ncbi:MAG: hypothetical protein V4496_08100 [Pseudomonadota bacterium]
MKSTLALISLAVLTLALSACHNRTDDYVNAQNKAPLKTPPGVTNSTFTDHNPIPKKSTPNVVAAPSLVPPGLTEDEAAAKIALAEKKKQPDPVVNNQDTNNTEQ